MANICPITTFPIEHRAIVVPCGHQFEEAAIRDWAAINPTCPMDRTPIQGINTGDRPVVQEEVVEEVPSTLSAGMPLISWSGSWKTEIHRKRKNGS